MLVVPHGGGLPRTDVGQIGSGPHRAEEDRAFPHVIARHGGTRSPATREVAAVANLADLLAMTIDTAGRRVDLLAALGQTRERRRVDVAGVLVDHRRVSREVEIRIGDQPEPGAKEGQEDPDNDDRHPVHALSGSGWRSWSVANKVGSVRVAPALSRRRVKLTAKTMCPAVRSRPEMLRRKSHGLV